MSLVSTYTSAYGKIPEFFGKLRDGQAPEQFTNQLLKDLGYKSTNHRAYVPLLKALGFLSPDGKPSSRYSEYRDHSNSKRVMGEALKEAYSDIFLIKESPTSSDKNTIQGKFKSYHNVGDAAAKQMTNTFYALLSLADLDSKESPKTSEAEKLTTEVPLSNSNPATEIPVSPAPGLHYNIQVHLPATKDIEVYNAIFKSLKEHLY